MCGIVGYIGQKKAWPILIKGLERLEYRGYDSAGIALLSKGFLSGSLAVYKKKGKVAELKNFIKGRNEDPLGMVGIAHTRWATHGEPSDRNAHPHLSNSGEIAIVHNGIIENYLAIKEILLKKGYKFESDTDTEVLVNLIEDVKKNAKTKNKKIERRTEDFNRGQSRQSGGDRHRKQRRGGIFYRFRRHPDY